MEANIIPRHASSVICAGPSGSGKTTMIVNMFTRSMFYLGYFDRVFLFSPSGECDPSFKILIDKKVVKKKDVISKDYINRLDEIMGKQKDAVAQKGSEFKGKRIAVIFEDLSSLGKLQRSESFIESFCANRHLSMSVWACVHKISSLSRVCRLQASCLFFWPAQNSEIEVLYDEHGPPGLSRDEFKRLVRYATAREKNKRNFLGIMVREPFETRYRKNLDEIIEVDV